MKTNNDSRSPRKKVNRRDNFTEETKRILGERVAWRCSFPGCPAITIGPGDDDSRHVVKTGEAAHITAAAQGGPRYDANLTPEERTAIENGIWMCKMHARLIDANDSIYAVQTLQQWKQLAEKRAYQELEQPHRDAAFPDTTTLVGIGPEILVEVVWIYSDEENWRFRIQDYLNGSVESIRGFVSRFATIKESERFVLVESQGEGRMIATPPSWVKTNGYDEIEIPIAPWVKPTDPRTRGADLALSASGDLIIKNGDLALVHGTESAIQSLNTILGTKKGEWVLNRELGSMCSKIYWRYKGNVPLLERALKMEIIRLATVPLREIYTEESSPSLDFVDRVLNVKVISPKLLNHRLQVHLELAMGAEQHWKGVVPIYICPRE